MGLLFIPFALIAGLASMATQQANSAIGGAAMLALGIIAPFIYGAMGFVFGAIGAWIYNLVAKWLGRHRNPTGSGSCDHSLGANSFGGDCFRA